MRIATCLALLTTFAFAGAEDKAARLLAEGDAAGARKAAKGVVEKSPTNERAWAVLADALVKLGEPEDAWGELEDNALPNNPKSAILLVKLGDVFAAIAQKKYRQSQGTAGLEVQNFYLDAVRTYDKALTIEAGNVDAVYGIGFVNYMMGKPDLARAQVAKALAMKKDHAKTHALQALMLYRDKKYPAAATSYETARKLDDSDPNVCYYYGHALYGAGKMDEARAAYKYMLKRHPDDGRSIIVGLKAVCRTDKKFDNAKYQQGLTEWAKEIKNSATLWEQIGDAARLRQDWKRAYGAYAKAAHLKPDDGVYPFWMGYAKESEGDADAAMKLYKTALRNKPELDDAAYRIEGMLRILRNFEELEAGYEELIKLAPGVANVHNNFALMLRDWSERRGARESSPPKAVRRRIKRAGEVYEIAAALAPDSAQIVSDTGLLFEFYPCNRDDRKAERYFTRSLEASRFLYRDAFDGLRRLCARTGSWEVLKDYAEGVIEAIDDGGRAIAPRGGREPTELSAAETNALRDRAKQALAIANRQLGED